MPICAGSRGCPLGGGHLSHQRCRNLVDPRSIKISDLHSCKERCQQRGASHQISYPLRVSHSSTTPNQSEPIAPFLERTEEWNRWPAEAPARHRAPTPQIRRGLLEISLSRIKSCPCRGPVARPGSVSGDRVVCFAEPRAAASARSCGSQRAVWCISDGGVAAYRNFRKRRGGGHHIRPAGVSAPEKAVTAHH